MNTASLITSKEWLGLATKKLSLVGISTPELDAVLLLCFSLNVTKIELLSKPNIMLSKNKLNLANKLLQQRELGYPIAYLTKKIEFYGHTFFVDNRVLIPRPESESFINILRAIDISKMKYLTDLGCGSGVLGITAKIEFPFLRVSLLDKSKRALNVTKINLKSSGVDAKVILSDLFSFYEDSPDIILANLPYVPKYMSVNKSASFEPKMAIFAENDGIFYYRKMLDQMKKKAISPKFILIECLDKQIEFIVKLFNRSGYFLIQSDGLVHLFSISF